jgi:hypothetical protein
MGYVPSRRNIADHINELDKMLTDGESIVKSIKRLFRCHLGLFWLLTGYLG